MTDPEFREAFQSHKDVLYRFAYRMTGSSTLAEDVVQESYMALWRRPGAHDPRRGSIRAFLIGIARDLILKRWRNERPHEALDAEDSICQPVDLPAGERAAFVAKAVSLLPPLQREALILAEYEELPLEEIARTVGAELAATKSRLHRARENLRGLLAPLREETGSVNGKR